jgi:hypothetical protein
MLERIFKESVDSKDKLLTVNNFGDFMISCKEAAGETDE